jgi:hypothetical protein
VSSDDDANLPESTDDHRPEDWLSADETLSLVRAATRSGQPRQAICKRAHAGLVRAWTSLLVVETKEHENCEIPREFWWAEGHEALEQDWDLGDFSTWIDRKYEIKAFGVQFHRHDIARMAPGALAKPIKIETAPRAGGRPKSSQWADWVAELAVYVHEDGIPAGDGASGAEALIEEIARRLEARDLSAPGRTTVQEAVSAVLRRLREETKPETPLK